MPALTAAVRRGAARTAIAASRDPGAVSESARRYPVPALEKGLDVLELLARTPDPMSPSAVAARLGRSLGELYRILQCLEQRGYLERDAESDRFRLSMKLFELAHARPATQSLSAAAVPVMERLAATIEQSCHLAVLDGLAIVIVAQATAPTPMHYAVRLGARFPAWETSSGFLLMAMSPQGPALAEALVAEQATFDRGAIEARCARIRAEGCEIRASSVVEGVTNLTRPVLDHLGNAIAALTIPYLPQRHLPTGIAIAADRLAAAAAAISASLGFRPTREVPRT